MIGVNSPSVAVIAFKSILLATNAAAVAAVHGNVKIPKTIKHVKWNTQPGSMSVEKHAKCRQAAPYRPCRLVLLSILAMVSRKKRQSPTTPSVPPDPGSRVNFIIWVCQSRDSMLVLSRLRLPERRASHFLDQGLQASIFGIFYTSDTDSKEKTGSRLLFCGTFWGTWIMDLSLIMDLGLDKTR
jgi:hypothetical protein